MCDMEGVYMPATKGKEDQKGVETQHAGIVVL